MIKIRLGENALRKGQLLKFEFTLTRFIEHLHGPIEFSLVFYTTQRLYIPEVENITLKLVV